MKATEMATNKKESFKGSVYLFFAFSLAGSSVICARFLSGKLGVFTITALSLLFSFLFLTLLCPQKILRTIRGMGFREWAELILQAFFGIFLFRMLLLQGLLLTSTSEAGILTGAAPAITAILAVTLLREPLRFKNLAGIISTIMGILLLQGIMTSGSSFSMSHFGGNILVLCAAASESIFNVLSRKQHLGNVSRKSITIDPIVQTALVSGIAGLFSTIPALFENPVPSILLLGPLEWAVLLWYGIVVTAVAYICWYAGIRRRSAQTAAAFSGLLPFTALLLSVTILGERAGLHQWAGGTLIVLGMILIGQQKPEEKSLTCAQET